MALTLNDFGGFETGGLEELSASASVTVNLDGAFTRVGRGTLFVSGSSAVAEFAPFANIADATGDYVVGFAVMTQTTTTPSSQQTFLSLREGTAEFLRLDLTTDGDVLVIDANGSTIRTISTPFAAIHTWYFYEIYFQHAASGTIEVFIDDSTQGSNSAQDLTDGGTFDTVRFSSTVSGTTTFRIEDYYLLSGATAASDHFGDFVVKTYQNTAEDATDQGDALAAGTWANVSETPGNESNEASYADTGNLAGSTICDEGTRAGPSGDSDLTGATIKGAKWVGKFKRGTGGGRTHLFSVGNDADWITTPTTKTDVTLSLTTAYVLTERLLEASDLSVPTTSDFFQHGFSKSATAGQDIFCAEIWAMLGYVPASGGGDITMLAAQGSYTLSGQAATTTKNTPVVASQGSYALTGKDAITSRTKSIPADQGAYTLNGQSANTLWSHAFAAVQGAYALTGQAAIISRQIAITAAQGAYALTGKDAITSQTKSIPADQGSYALTGKDAGTRVGQTLAAVQGAYALSGQAANFLFDHLIAAVQGSYALSGQAAITTKDTPMTAAQGAYALNGQAAILLRNHLIAAAQGSYALDGQAAVLTRQITITAVQGSYVLSGQAADLKRHLVLAAQGAYALTGQAAILSRQVTIVGAQGAYTLTGQAANLLLGHLVAASQGAYALTGQAAVTTKNTPVVASQGAYSINGQAAGLLRGHALPAVQGSYALTGKDALTFEGARLTAVQGSYVLNGQAVVFVVVGGGGGRISLPLLGVG